MKTEAFWSDIYTSPSRDSQSGNGTPRGQIFTSLSSTSSLKRLLWENKIPLPEKESLICFHALSCIF